MSSHSNSPLLIEATTASTTVRPSPIIPTIIAMDMVSASTSTSTTNSDANVNIDANNDAMADSKLMKIDGEDCKVKEVSVLNQAPNQYSMFLDANLFLGDITQQVFTSFKGCYAYIGADYKYCVPLKDEGEYRYIVGHSWLHRNFVVLYSKSESGSVIIEFLEIKTMKRTVIHRCDKDDCSRGHNVYDFIKAAGLWDVLNAELKRPPIEGVEGEKKYQTMGHYLYNNKRIEVMHYNEDSSILGIIGKRVNHIPPAYITFHIDNLLFIGMYDKVGVYNIDTESYYTTPITIESAEAALGSRVMNIHKLKDYYYFLMEGGYMLKLKFEVDDQEFIPVECEPCSTLSWKTSSIKRDDAKQQGGILDKV